MALHVLIPLIVARIKWHSRWIAAWMIMVSTWVVDLDHLLAVPVFDPNRCSLCVHPLHSWPAMAAYLVLAAQPKTRLIGLGLVIHMALDGVDCIWMALS